MTIPSYEYQDTPRMYYKTINNLEQFKNYINHELDHPLKKTARHTVFSNDTDADIMVIGEAPGEDEDASGKPFTGRSGQLLMKIFESIHLSRDDLYITNLVPWRPPLNRTPSPEEMAFFMPILKKHIALKKPKIIILLGGVVTKALISPKIEISKVRGSILNLEIDGNIYKAIPTFHPAYLLRSPRMKKLAWEDMCHLNQILQTS